jgi:DNA polymerase
MTDDPVEDPREELSRLTRGLRFAVARRSAFGRRRLPVPLPTVVLPSKAPPGPAAPAPSVGSAAPSGTLSPGDAPSLPDLESLRAAVATCTACGLHACRTQTVFSDGRGTSGVMFVGEAPGFHEDQQGVPFVGRSGQLLTDIIEKGMGLSREEVTIANVLKCRPPENRDPTSEEKKTCTPWLDRQIELVQPRILIALGRHAAGHLLGSEASLGRLRGRVHLRGSTKVVVTYHPSYLLRTPSDKAECWKDIQLAMAEIGLQPPARGRPSG